MLMHKKFLVISQHQSTDRNILLWCHKYLKNNIYTNTSLKTYKKIIIQIHIIQMNKRLLQKAFLIHLITIMIN